MNNRFFTFNQNNSGGNFLFDAQAGISHYVIIEAASYDEANRLAEDKGLYFDGCSTERDCPCCGDRWYAQWRDEKGSEKPEVYGEDVTKLRKAKRLWGNVDKGTLGNWMGDGVPEIFVHYKSGAVVGYCQ